MKADADLLPVALRDTAVTVTDLGDVNIERSVADLKHECQAQIAGMRVELRQRGLPPDVIEDAVYAQCALLDETALGHLNDDARGEWEREPLQLDEFKTNDAGEELVRRIQRRLHESQPVRPLLAIFGTVLDLGFTGQLALEGSDSKAKLRQAIDARLGAARRLDTDNDASIIVKAAVVRAWTQRISPLGCIALACVAVGLVWFAVDRWLDASVARMMH
ncbi:DotU/TssL family secretion system protein [Caballeronia sp. ATUFL_M2_KS44]|uniref:DotU/TssL family secretion system protein n=1 Tax=Caballeronia sp. ATUFL_M2_KS44 TaxID=2921767 RepID=UPI002027E831|nr:DotU/TssL family secretion system protein [Caballeronia sp. ATUFL_M2_KS44]